MYRYYRETLPRPDDIVMVRIEKENDFGYSGILLEYSETEAVADYNQLVNKRLNRDSKLKIGRVYPLKVINVNEDKRMVELSKKRIDLDDLERTRIRYEVCTNITKFIQEIHTLAEYYDKRNGVDIQNDLEDLFESIAWSNYDEHHDNEDDKNNNPHQKIYENYLKNIKALINSLYATDKAEFIIDNIENRMIQKDCSIMCDLKLQVTNENAIDKIKDVLNIGDIGEDYTVNIYASSPPLYKLRIEGRNEEECRTLMNKIIEGMEKKFQNLEERRGSIFKRLETNIEKESTYELRFFNEHENKIYAT